MENAQRYKTPQYLDEPYRLIIFTLDEVFIMGFTIYILGFVCGFIITSLFLSCILTFLARRMKGNEGPYFYLHMLYWHFSLSPGLRMTPPSWIREFLG